MASINMMFTLYRDAVVSRNTIKLVHDAHVFSRDEEICERYIDRILFFVLNLSINWIKVLSVSNSLTFFG